MSVVLPFSPVMTFSIDGRSQRSPSLLLRDIAHIILTRLIPLLALLDFLSQMPVLENLMPSECHLSRREAKRRAARARMQVAARELRSEGGIAPLHPLPEDAQSDAPVVRHPVSARSVICGPCTPMLTRLERTAARRTTYEDSDAALRFGMTWSVNHNPIGATCSLDCPQLRNRSRTPE
jgi:hypothetical protein